MDIHPVGRPLQKDILTGSRSMWRAVDGCGEPPTGICHNDSHYHEWNDIPYWKSSFSRLTKHIIVNNKTN